MKMNSYRAQELLVPLKKGTAQGISEPWKDRLIEALEYVVENEGCPHTSVKGDNYGTTCTDCGEILSGYGYGGWFGRDLPDPLPECKHQFVSYDDDEICLFCETTRRQSEE